jgi:hypothetical protein
MTGIKPAYFHETEIFYWGLQVEISAAAQHSSKLVVEGINKQKAADIVLAM